MSDTTNEGAKRDEHFGDSQRFRNPAEVIMANMGMTRSMYRRVSSFQVTGDWWDLLEQLSVTLVISREYEHMLVALSSVCGSHDVSSVEIPHPSGLAFDAEAGSLYVACTRNPNQIVEFRRATKFLRRFESRVTDIYGWSQALAPTRSAFYPGALYLHDIAIIGRELYANAVGMNSIIRFGQNGGFSSVWWPKVIEDKGRPDQSRNYIQLNSIGAGESVNDSWFTASSAKMSSRRPGHLNYPVDGTGVVFSGKTREPVAFGLTRPHSARIDGELLWVANSGYGELVYFETADLRIRTSTHGEVFARLPGWTRGVRAYGDVVFVGTSKILPRYQRYAPGLVNTQSFCGVHAIERTSGKVLGSVIWPEGNQIFAIEVVPRDFSPGFFNQSIKYQSERERQFYYNYLTEETND